MGVILQCINEAGKVKIEGVRANPGMHSLAARVTIPFSLAFWTFVFYNYQVEGQGARIFFTGFHVPRVNITPRRNNFSQGRKQRKWAFVGKI